MLVPTRATLFGIVLLLLVPSASGARECLSPLGTFEVADVRDLSAAGDLLFVAAGAAGLLVVDVSEPTAPELVGSWRPSGPGVADGVAVEGQYAYVAAGPAGMRIVDVADPSAPVEVGAVSGEACVDVEVVDGVAYLALDQQGLRIADVSDPHAPAVLGAYLYGLAEHVSVAGRFAFVAGGCSSLILDVSDPSRPLAVTAPGLGAFNDVAVEGSTAYFAQGCSTDFPKQGGPGRLAVVDLAAAGGPVEVGALELPEYATGVAVTGRLALVASPERVWAVDVTDRTLPSPVSSYQPVTGAGDLTLAGNLVAVAGQGELEVLDLAGCAAVFVSSYVMGVAHLEGHSGTRWRSDVEVCNLDPVERHAEMALLERGRANLDPATVGLDLPAGQCERFEDVVSSVFGVVDTAGTIRLTSTTRLPCSARTFNATEQGSYGSSMAGRSEEEALRAGDTGALIQLSQSVSLDRGFRTNLELVNLAGVPTTVEVELYSAGGTLLATRAEELAAFEDVQLGRVFQDSYILEVSDGYALVRTLDPGGAFLANATVVDNLTGDGTSVPVIRR